MYTLVTFIGYKIISKRNRVKLFIRFNRIFGKIINNSSF